VAAGRAGLYFEFSTCLWDYAAGALLVQEAGGVCRTLAGDPLPRTAYKRTTIVAAAPDILAESGLIQG
jgi:myo-inositol-1(or 4)-monophosphatase